MLCICASYLYCIQCKFWNLGIIINHIPHQGKFSRKETGIDSSYDGSKLFTTIPGPCKVSLGLTDSDILGVLDHFVERHIHLQDQA